MRKERAGREICPTPATTRIHPTHPPLTKPHAPSHPQVFKAIVAVGTPAAEADLAPVEALISEAYQEIDKAVQKGVLHANTGARRKARLAAAKRAALIKGGLYTPA